MQTSDIWNIISRVKIFCLLTIYFYQIPNEKELVLSVIK